MPKIIGPLFSLIAKGIFGPRMVFSNRKTGQQMRLQKAQSDVITESRTEIRDIYRTLVTEWNELSTEDKQQYIESAKILNMSGYNLYIKENWPPHEPVYDVDYQAVLDRASTLGYTLPSLPKRLIENAFMIALKAVFGVTSISSAPILQILMFKTDGDSDYATLNWASPSTRQATKINSPTFTSDTGFNSDGTTSYLNSGLTLFNIPNKQNFAVAVRAYLAGSDGGKITGAGDTNSSTIEAFYVIPYNGSVLETRFFKSSGSAATLANTASNNRLIVGVTPSGGNAINRMSINGAAYSSITLNFDVADLDRDIPILAYRGTSVTSFYRKGVSYRIVFSRNLTNTEVANLDTALQAYLA